MELRDVIKARKQHEKQFSQEQVVFIGKVALRDGKTTVPGVFDHTWVLPPGGGEPVAVFNREVKNNRPDMGVQVGFAPYSTQLEILRSDINSTAGVVSTAGIDMQNHAHSHRVKDGDDPLFIEEEAIVILLTYPTGATGLKVKVSPYVYVKDGVYTRFNGHPAFDLSAHEPAVGLARFVLIYLNKTTNALGTVAGATTVDSEAILPVLPDLPAGGVGSAFVRLAGGQTSFDWDDFYPARDFLGGGSDELVKVSANDTTPGYLNGKLVAGANVTFVEGSDGANETLTIAAESAGITIKNTSGATAAAGDVGYIDAASEYKTTTTIAFVGSWCVVTTGGANNADIAVATQGRRTVNYSGTDPIAGGFLLTSSTAGKAQFQEQATMRPEIFAVCTAAGSGGTVEALLLIDTKRRIFTNANDTLRINFMSDTDFVATINGAPSGTSVVYNAPSSGAEDTINVASSSQVGKLVLHNTTRGDSALISSVNTSTNTITLTATAPGTWQSGDTITMRSQTASGAVETGVYFYDIDLSGLSLPGLTRHIEIAISHRDSAASATLYHLVHPFQAVTGAFATGDFISAAADIFNAKETVIALIGNKMCFAVQASGTGTSSIIIRIRAIDVAEA